MANLWSPFASTTAVLYPDLHYCPERNKYPVFITIGILVGAGGIDVCVTGTALLCVADERQEERIISFNWVVFASEDLEYAL